ncbi:hypothetical protein HU200_016415 [Digitaria exilis]|uniref:Uncharacterized protein n=1 Tax=Digitaria exilis TaxID=1010633 RepID=A0A835F915_9POAL|nr:hypothetical protein HU200_016415 [Digitaria exilis]
MLTRFLDGSRQASGGASGFVPTPSSSCPPPIADHQSFALDARHGRVLLYRSTHHCSRLSSFGELPVRGLEPSHRPVMIGPSLLVGDALHFAIEDARRILAYDFGGRGMSVFAMPVNNLVTAENGGLGVAGFDDHNLHLWSWRIDTDNGVGMWNKDRVIELDMVDISVPSTPFIMLSYAEGAHTIVVCRFDGIFTVNQKSGKVKKVRPNGHF